MRKTENTIFTNMCMLYDDSGNVLVQNRLNPDWPGITFPGGHVENGELFTDAVIREIYEETGLTVSHLHMCGIKDWFCEDGTRYVVHLYKTNVFEGKLASSNEGDIWWVPLRELPSMKLCEGMQTMLKLFFEDDLTELFVYKENDKWKEVLK